MDSLVKEIVEALKIPVVESTQKIWFFRTNGGTFYFDYRLNDYIALGWDKIDEDFICDKQIKWNVKKEVVKDLYPDELRPGLILGQLHSFYNEMKEGDFIVIPSYGTKKISIGILGNIAGEMKHKVLGEDYVKCNYTHKRKVSWIKEVELLQDVYLFKALRAQQTISDITNCGNMVFRNLYPYYISDDEVHLTLQKTTVSEYSLATNIKIQTAFYSIVKEISALYGADNIEEKIRLKTAVGSPGFLEMILSVVDLASISSVVLIFKTLIGKIETSDGSKVSGVLAIIEEINKLANDRQSRKNLVAEEDKIKAEAEKTRAETEKIKAETERISIENEALKNAQTKHEIPSSEKVLAIIETVAENCEELSNATKAAGIKCENPVDTDEIAS